MAEYVILKKVGKCPNCKYGYVELPDTAFRCSNCAGEGEIYEKVDLLDMLKKLWWDEKAHAFQDEVLGCCFGDDLRIDE